MRCAPLSLRELQQVEGGGGGHEKLRLRRPCEGKLYVTLV